MVSDVCVDLLTALDEYGVIARGLDAEGYGVTLQGLAKMEADGWKFEAPADTEEQPK